MAPSSILLVVVLGAILLVLLTMLFRKNKKSPSPRFERDLSNLIITDARQGDSVSVMGAGDEFEDLDFVVDRRNRYESDDETWHELSGLYKGRRIFLEYSEDDEVEVTLNLSRQELKLSDLGLTEDELSRMDEEQSASNSLTFEGQVWHYAISREVGYFRDGRGEGEGYYTWTFESEEKKRELFIEKWEGEPFKAGVASVVNPNDIKVYRS